MCNRAGFHVPHVGYVWSPGSRIVGHVELSVPAASKAVYKMTECKVLPSVTYNMILRRSDYRSLDMLHFHIGEVFFHLHCI